MSEAPEEITYVCCIEHGRLEQQTLTMIASLRAFGGSLGQGRILCVIGRKGAALSPHTREALHSLGAELAVWSAANAGISGVVGTLALSPGSRSHLRISPSDLLMTSEPRGADSFAVSDQVVAATSLGPRIAIIRGSGDKFRSADVSLLAAGGSSVRRFVVPFASHSLRNLTLARYSIRDALEWLLEPRPSGYRERAVRS